MTKPADFRSGRRTFLGLEDWLHLVDQLVTGLACGVSVCLASWSGSRQDQGPAAGQLGAGHRRGDSWPGRPCEPQRKLQDLVVMFIDSSVLALQSLVKLASPQRPSALLVKKLN